MNDRLQRWINVTDAEHECSHGCLPHDRHKPADCKCWDRASEAALAHKAPDMAGFTDFVLDD